MLLWHNPDGPSLPLRPLAPITWTSELSAFMYSHVTGLKISFSFSKSISTNFPKEYAVRFPVSDVKCTLGAMAPLGCGPEVFKEFMSSANCCMSIVNTSLPSLKILKLVWNVHSFKYLTGLFKSFYLGIFFFFLKDLKSKQTARA